MVLKRPLPEGGTTTEKRSLRFDAKRPSKCAGADATTFLGEDNFIRSRHGFKCGTEFTQRAAHRAGEFTRALGRARFQLRQFGSDFLSHRLRECRSRSRATDLDRVSEDDTCATTYNFTGITRALSTYTSASTRETLSPSPGERFSRTSPTCESARLKSGFFIAGSSKESVPLFS